MAPAGGAWPPIAAALLAFALIALATRLAPRPMLIADRFWPGTGWLEAGLIAVYAGFVMRAMRTPEGARKTRPRIWRLFTVVFFGQLLLGLLGFERFLMSGQLHLPVPALIVAGPIYRGGGYFMVALFLSTIVLVGPAWCSHLCYIGAWDDTASRARKTPQPLPKWRPKARLAILIAVVAAALALRVGGASPATAAWVGAGFGLIGVGIMLTASRRTGAMAHCTTWCPVGLAANILGKLNPFRLRIGEGCTECRVCTRACRYEALTLDDIRRRMPGLSCTLCGDCLASCRHRQLHYRFPGLSPDAARTLFLVLVVGLHAAFLALARI